MYVSESVWANGGAVANRLRRRTSDQTVLGSNPAVAAALSPWTRLFTPIIVSQGEAFTLASISYLAILVKYILAKKKKMSAFVFVFVRVCARVCVCVQA